MGGDWPAEGPPPPTPVNTSATPGTAIFTGSTPVRDAALSLVQLAAGATREDFFGGDASERLQVIAPAIDTSGVDSFGRRELSALDAIDGARSRAMHGDAEREVRKCRACVYPLVGSAWINVSSTLREEYVGCEEVDDGVWNVWFGPLLLGRFDERELKIYGVHGLQ